MKDYYLLLLIIAYYLGVVRKVHIMIKKICIVGRVGVKFSVDLILISDVSLNVHTATR